MDETLSAIGHSERQVRSSGPKSRNLVLAWVRFVVNHLGAVSRFLRSVPARRDSGRNDDCGTREMAGKVPTLRIALRCGRNAIGRAFQFENQELV